MTHNVINCGLPLPAEASKFQRKVIHELKDFSDYMAVLLNPFIAVK
jgi:D-ribose pyranose/furanose isomerase RbsD